jgi:hypothetical protein
MCSFDTERAFEASRFLAIRCRIRPKLLTLRRGKALMLASQEPRQREPVGEGVLLSVIPTQESAKSVLNTNGLMNLLDSFGPLN